MSLIHSSPKNKQTIHIQSIAQSLLCTVLRTLPHHPNIVRFYGGSVSPKNSLICELLPRKFVLFHIKITKPTPQQLRLNKSTKKKKKKAWAKLSMDRRHWIFPKKSIFSSASARQCSFCMRIELWTSIFLRTQYMLASLLAWRMPAMHPYIHLVNLHSIVTKFS